MCILTLSKSRKKKKVCNLHSHRSTHMRKLLKDNGAVYKAEPELSGTADNNQINRNHLPDTTTRCQRTPRRVASIFRPLFIFSPVLPSLSHFRPFYFPLSFRLLPSAVHKAFETSLSFLTPLVSFLSLFPNVRRGQRRILKKRMPERRRWTNLPHRLAHTHTHNTHARISVTHTVGMETHARTYKSSGLVRGHMNQQVASIDQCCCGYICVCVCVPRSYALTAM